MRKILSIILVIFLFFIASVCSAEDEIIDQTENWILTRTQTDDSVSYDLMTNVKFLYDNHSVIKIMQHNEMAFVSLCRLHSGYVEVKVDKNKIMKLGTSKPWKNQYVFIIDSLSINKLIYQMKQGKNLMVWFDYNNSDAGCSSSISVSLEGFTRLYDKWLELLNS
jgi:hypothetical protein